MLPPMWLPKLLISGLFLLMAWFGASSAKEGFEYGDSLWEVCFYALYSICGLVGAPIVLFIL